MPEFVKVVLWDALLTVVILAAVLLITGTVLAVWRKISLPLDNWRMRRTLEKLAMWRARKALYENYEGKRALTPMHPAWKRYEESVGLEAKYTERASIALAVQKKAGLKDDSKKNN